MVRRASAPSHWHRIRGYGRGTRAGVRAGGVRSVRNLRNLARGGRCWRGNDTDYQLGFGQACRGVLSPLGGGRRRGACRRGAPPPRDPWNRYRVLSSANAGRSSRSASLTRSPARWAWPARPPRPIGARLATPGLPSASRRVPRPLADGVGWIWSALPNERGDGDGEGVGRRVGEAEGLKRNGVWDDEATARGT